MTLADALNRRIKPRAEDDDSDVLSAPADHTDDSDMESPGDNSEPSSQEEEDDDDDDLVRAEQYS